jgi:hypothetical protein
MTLNCDEVELLHNGWTVYLMGNWFHAQRGEEHKWIWRDGWQEITERHRRALNGYAEDFGGIWLDAVLPQELL